MMRASLVRAKPLSEKMALGAFQDLFLRMQVSVCVCVCVFEENMLPWVVMTHGSFRRWTQGGGSAVPASNKHRTECDTFRSSLVVVHVASMFGFVPDCAPEVMRMRRLMRMRMEGSGIEQQHPIWRSTGQHVIPPPHPTPPPSQLWMDNLSRRDQYMAFMDAHEIYEIREHDGGLVNHCIGSGSGCFEKDGKKNKFGKSKWHIFGGTTNHKVGW